MKSRLNTGITGFCKSLGMSSEQVHSRRARDACLSPLGNSLRADAKHLGDGYRTAKAIDNEGVGLSVHADHCNYSCTPEANHSCTDTCNYCYAMPDTLAETIKTIRTAAGDSPAAAAKKVGVSRQGYVKWEQGDTKNMKLGNLITFCDSYKVGVDELLRGMIVFGEAHPAADIEYQAPARASRVAIGLTATPLPLKVEEPNPEVRELIEGFAVAESGVRKAMLAIAREAITAFGKRSEKSE